MVGIANDAVRPSELFDRFGAKGPGRPGMLRVLTRDWKYGFVRSRYSNLVSVSADRLKLIQKKLIGAGQIANDDFTRGQIGAIVQRAIAEERIAFCGFLAAFSPSDLYTVKPLPFRRVLSDEEAKTLWSRLRDRWQIDLDYWYPLADCAVPGVLAFHAPAFAGIKRYKTVAAPFGTPDRDALGRDRRAVARAQRRVIDPCLVACVHGGA